MSGTAIVTCFTNHHHLTFLLYESHQFFIRLSSISDKLQIKIQPHSLDSFSWLSPWEHNRITHSLQLEHSEFLTLIKVTCEGTDRIFSYIDCGLAASEALIQSSSLSSLDTEMFSSVSISFFNLEYGGKLGLDETAYIPEARNSIIAAQACTQ